MDSSDEGRGENFQTPLKTPRTRFRKRFEAGDKENVQEMSLTETPHSDKVWQTPNSVRPEDRIKELQDNVTKQDRVICEQAEIIQSLRRAQNDNNARLSTCSADGLHTPVSEFSNRELAKSERKYRVLQQEIIFEKNRNRDLDLQITERNGRIDQLSEELNLAQDKLQSQHNKEADWNQRENGLKAEIHDLDSRNRGLEAQLRGAKQQASELRVKLADLEKLVNLYKVQIEDAKEDERRRSDEVRQREGVLAKRETELAVRRSMDVGVLNFGRFLEEQLMSKLTTHIFNIQPHCQAVDLIKLGSLTATNDFLQQQVIELKQREEELNKLLDSAREQAKTSKEDLELLQKKLIDMEGNAELTTQYLHDENNKAKKEKANLRCDLLSAQRENNRLQERIKQLELLAANHSEVETVREQLLICSNTKERAEKREEESRQREAELRITVEEMQKKLGEIKEKDDSLTIVCAERDLLRNRLQNEEQKSSVLVKGLADLNDQIELAMRQRKRFEDRLIRAQTDVLDLNGKLREKERELEGVKKAEAEMATVRSENERLTDKISYLQDELQETHTDYREELARLAKQCSDSRSAGDREGLEKTISELKSSISQLESQLRAAKRQNEEMKQDNKRLADQIADIRERERVTNEENGKLREGLINAVGKAEKYKSEAAETSDALQSSQDELERNKEKLRRLEVEVTDLDDVIKEKERLVGYLQGQTNAQKMPKSKSKTTLLFHPSDSSLEQIDMEVIELESMRLQLREQLEKKRQELNVRKGSADSSSSDPVRTSEVPNYSSPRKPPPARAPLSLMRSAPELGSSQVGRQMEKSLTVGKMRHDIPHKWRSQLGFALRQIKCCMCFEGIPRVGYAMRCSECEVVVHRHCVPRVTNTCGFPTQFAAFYHDHQMGSSAPGASSSNGTSMNGWVRLYHSLDPHWRSCFALMENGKLAFYDSEGLAGNLDKAVLAVELEHGDSWSVRSSGEGPNGVRDAEYAHCIQIRQHQGDTVYLLCPTEDSTKRWHSALQAASRRRHLLTRRPSSFSAATLLLALDTPNNITINAALAVDDWLLIGAQEGLFATSLSDPRNPFMVSCGGAVHALESLYELGFVACVMGKNRQLGLLSTSQLRIELTSRQPALRPQNIAGLEYVHLLAYHQEGTNRYLLAADANCIHILQYKRDFFTAHMSISTEEPVTCILSAHGGFYYGSDSFFFAHSLYSGQPQVRPLAQSHVADYPLSVLEVGDDEVLLAYQNYGVFMNSRGEQTREKIVEWEQTPMEFAYTAPFLYAVHFDSLEIMQVHDYEGPKSRTVSDEREVYCAKQAHLVGTRNDAEVLVSLSSNQRVELHSFNAINQKKNGSKRRALANAFSMGTLDKKSRVNLMM